MPVHIAAKEKVRKAIVKRSTMWTNGLEQGQAHLVYAPALRLCPPYAPTATSSIRKHDRQLGPKLGFPRSLLIC